MDNQQNEYRIPKTDAEQNNSPYGNVNSLANQGVDSDSIFNETEQETVNEADYENPNKAAANKDMMVGALWCVGGIIATMSMDGVLWWGAILFGGIQFFRGLANS
jgi:hypothetical protein